MSGAWNEVPTKSHSSGMLRIQMAWMILKFVTYCVVKKFGGTGNRSNSSPEHSP